MDNFFINALVQAGSCRKHRLWKPIPVNVASLHNHCRSRRKRADEGIGGGRVGEDGNAASRRFGHAAGPRNRQTSENNGHKKKQEQREQREQQDQQEQPVVAAGNHQPTLAQLKRLVDFYGPPARLETWKEQEEREAREEEEEGGGLTLSDQQGVDEDGDVKQARLPFHQRHQPWPNKDEVENESIGELEELLEHDGLSPELAYEIYSSLSWPRAAYLSYNTIRNLLHCLGVVRHYGEKSMMRYLAVIDDMKAADIPIALADWNMAIQFAGKCLRKVTNNEVESALWLWREMEQQVGTRGNHVTFNILFDIAVKAGKYKLAEMIRNEMKARNLKLDRFFRTSTIMWRGLSRDGEGVRKAYKELVEAGEIVDSAVMNCVITALFNAGEPSAAEQVFLRMKDMAGVFETTKKPPQDWRQRRELGLLLKKAAERTRGDSEGQRIIQEHSPVGPDHGTFKILIKHHINETGNIDRITQLLDEMDRVYNIPIEGDIFFALFWGFHNHGGVRYSPWSKARLEGTWRAFLMSLDNESSKVTLDRSITKAVIMAFSKCTNEEQTLRVWGEIRQRWNPSGADLQSTIHLLGNVSYSATYVPPA
ncbi:pentatricopeptide repeat protein [Diplodia corticola]|uniref:Pentatricopeptide repeat protein n=1 Tax=Diplodia corticola TaxID=236234 RepID=A0A1J9RMC7_9PEZI|nr:pentatricopeptide repeat protein [Diplodia corticola]OJD28757.1 pentatricopeptide repeat protein [Diplodia corticola]